MSKKIERYTIKVLDSDDFEVAIKELKEREVTFTKKGSRLYFDTPTGGVEITRGGTVVHDLLGTVSLTEALSELNQTEEEANEVREGYDLGDGLEEYEALQYKGKEWGVFAKRSNAWVVFGTPTQMKERAKSLNEMEKEGNKKLGDSEIKPKDGAINYSHSKDGMPSYGVDLREIQTEDDNLWMQDMLDETSNLIDEANGEITDRGYELSEDFGDDYMGDEVKLIVEVGYENGFTMNIVVDSSEVSQELLDFAFGKMADIAETVGLVKMEYGGWTGPVYLKDGNTVSLLIGGLKDMDGKLKYIGPEFQIQINTSKKPPSGRREDDIYAEVFGYVEKHPELFTYKNKELKSWKDYSKKDLEEELDLRFDYDKEAFDEEELKYHDSEFDEYTNTIDYVICRGKRYPTTTVEEVTELIEGNRWGEELNRILATLTYEDTFLILNESAWIKNYLTKIEFEEMMLSLGLEESSSTKLGDSKFKDMNAEEIITLINEAGEKGRSWGWLEGKLPDEFKHLANKYGSLFPVQQDWRGASGLVHLKRPKQFGADISFDWIKDYNELKSEIDNLYNKYGGTDRQTLMLEIDVLIEEEDSISKRALLQGDREKFKYLAKAVSDLLTDSGFKQTYDYWAGDFINKDFVFNKQKYLKAINTGHDSKRHNESQKRALVGTPGKKYITSKDDKVEPLSEDAESYIRKIMKETDTDTIKSKREVRGKRKYSGSKDILDLWQEDRRELSSLLSRLKNLQSEGTISGMSLTPSKDKLIYVGEKEGNYDYNGRYKYGGGYKLAGNRTKPQARVNGVDEELQKPLSEAIARAFSATSVEELRTALEQALSSVDMLPDDSSKIKEAKQKIIVFLEKHKQSLTKRREGRTRKLPDSGRPKLGDRREDIATSYIYLFPEDMTPEDLEEANNYGLKYIGRNHFDTENNYVIQGNKRNIYRYAREYLGYEIQPDYLYRKDEFAGNIT